MVESLNSWILDGRNFLIKTMMELIRKKTMNRLDIKCPLCEKWINCYSPACNDIFQIKKGLVVGCEVIFSCDTCYEVEEGDDTHTHTHTHYVFT